MGSRSHSCAFSMLHTLLSFLPIIFMCSHSQFRGDSLRRRAPTNVPRHRRGRPRKAQQGVRYTNGHGNCGEEILVRSKLRDAHTTAALTDVIFNSAQRNVYLTGFCLFLSLVLTRTFYIILDLIHTQEEYAKLKKAVRCPCSLTSVCVGLNGRDVLLDGFFVS